MKNFLKEWGVFSLIIIAFILSRWLIWSPVTVDGHSMDPTLQDSERLLMVKTASIERFDIVVASELDEHGKEKLIVKRVIGMPGDTIRYENDVLYINDEQVDEPYLKESLAAFSKDKLQSAYSFNKSFQILAQNAGNFTLDANGSPNFTVQVPKDQYYLIGDDRLVSQDSRVVGSFSKDSLEGEIVFRLWPLDRIGNIK
ncbi:signal peptidase I [Streptococcus sp. X16XC17]|uniref:signal peptidase I n=1 Tax=unclassified Streptococcus TaxID=2608887 RepID=UPI00066FC29A|nr:MULTISPECIES: signal peptidase I [unclassified Streptococcus]TCD45565.1 signal peptidase I [Streptococcus sp. X16XC17]